MKERFEAFDGLRGLAALVVVLGHFLPDGPIRNFLSWMLLTDTKIAVAIFFVLSGFVLCRPGQMIHYSDNPLINFCKKVVARFVRLALPVFGISILVFLIHPFIQPSSDPTVHWNIFTKKG